MERSAKDKNKNTKRPKPETRGYRSTEGWSRLPFGMKVKCCSCGQVDTWRFRNRNGYTEFRVARDHRATGQARRWRKT